MKISYSKDEIIVDLTQTNIKNKIDGDGEIVLVKTNYLVPLLNGVPKLLISYNRNKVNAHYLNCTCKEYRDNTKLFPIRDLRRICKHIFFVVTKDYSNKLDEITSLLLAHRFWDKISDVYELEYQNETIFIGFEKKFNLIRVYRKNTNWKFYTYQPDKKNWTNNLPPFKESNYNQALSKYIQNLISDFSKLKKVS